MATPSRQDLLVLVADADIEQAVLGLMTRTESMGIRPCTYEIRRHPGRDPGCRVGAAQFLRPFSRRFRYALVVFDRHGCGDPGSRESIQRRVEDDLRANGWANRSKALVIDPELEVWLWSQSAHVAEALGWRRNYAGLRQFLKSQDLWPDESTKPIQPKKAMWEAMKAAPMKKKARRSAAKFQKLASQVDFAGCVDPAFAELTGTLRRWFASERGAR